MCQDLADHGHVRSARSIWVAAECRKRWGAPPAVGGACRPPSRGRMADELNGREEPAPG